MFTDEFFKIISLFCSCDNRMSLDRSQGLQIVSEVEDTLKKLQEFVLELERHLQQRKNLLSLLEQAELFYDTQLSEACIVEKVSF